MMVGFPSRPIINNNLSYPSLHGNQIPPQPVFPPIPKRSADSYSAFGRVIEGEWSQFSKTVEEFIDENASKLQFLGSNQPQVNSTNQYLPNIDYNNDSLSGLSALGGTESNFGSFKKGDSIMNLVMHQSNDPEAFQKKKKEQDIPKKDLLSHEHHEFDHDVSYQRMLPPPCHINSNMSFLGTGITMSQNLEHSLMAPPEFDAVSALNQMSNSSFGFNPPNSYQRENIMKESSSSKKTSFFEKVIGNNKK
jgi:hypothetical protein